MPKVKSTTITDKKIAEYFNTTTQTLRNWKNSDDEKLKRRYIAFKKYFLSEVKD
jgi:hypothetical protein